MKILIVGGAGREHALAWRLRQSPEVEKLFASPGNPGIAKHATCLAEPPSIAGYADLAEANAIDLTIVGPEAPLVAGIVDEFQQRGLKIIGPTQAAAKLEGSKIFAKEFFRRANIPTARFIACASRHQALEATKRFGLPVVIKADGLCAGKGVVIAHNHMETIAAVAKLGPTLVVEEFLDGEEVSFIGLSDGRQILPFTPAQDHKRALDNDQGPNTGGMGAYSDRRILTAAQMDDITEGIMLPTLHQMRAEGAPFTGFLYAGLIMTSGGPKLLEFNVRLGDPEAQAILHSFAGDLVASLTSLTKPPTTQNSCSVCVTLAAEKYPETPRLGDAIEGIADAEATGATVFQAGTKLNGDRLVTSGGRVLGVTASANTLQAAIDRAYAAAGKIHFRGMHYRTDIGQKGLRRW